MGKLLAIILTAFVIWVLLFVGIFINENIIDLGATITVKEYLSGESILAALIIAIGIYFISKIFRR